MTTDLRFPTRWPMIWSRPSRRGPSGRVSASNVKEAMALEMCGAASDRFGASRSRSLRGLSMAHARHGRHRRQNAPTEDELRQQSQGRIEKDLGALEYDQASGVYRPAKRD